MPALTTAGRLLGHPLTVGAVAVGGAAYLAAVDPHDPGRYPPCPFLLLTGWRCPGCGGLRAVHDLLHGDLAAALTQNPLAVLAVLSAVLGWAFWARARLTGRGSPPRIPPFAAWAAAAGVAAFWLLRNVSGTS